MEMLDFSAKWYQQVNCLHMVAYIEGSWYFREHILIGQTIAGNVCKEGTRDHTMVIN